MSKVQMEISLESEAFEEFKYQFDEILQATILNMTLKGASDGRISVGMDVHIDEVPNANGEMILVPTFRHNINSVLQIKNTAKGSLVGDYVLTLDKKTGRYVMTFNDDGQVGLFSDGNGQYVDYPTEYDDYDYEPVEAS